MPISDRIEQVELTDDQDQRKEEEGPFGDGMGSVEMVEPGGDEI